MRARVLAALLVGVAATVVAIGQAEAKGASERSLARLEPADQDIVRRIHRFQRKTWHLQRVMGRRQTPTNHTAHDTSVGRAYRLWVLNLWRHRADAAWRDFQRPPHYAAWRCIHRYEGAWNDGGGPYYGGLQMDVGFQRAYGSYLLAKKGTADRWSPLEQMWVAERAVRTRGFSPWPSTARICGLI